MSPQIFPQTVAVPNTIHAVSLACLGDILHPNLAVSAAGVWPAANRALFFPFEINDLATIVGAMASQATSSGNVDVGVYDAAGNRIVSSGSTAATGSALQTISLTPTALGPGNYYMALACDNTTISFFKWNPGIQLAQTVGVQQMASAFPLPSTATYANPASDYITEMALLLVTI